MNRKRSTKRLINEKSHFQLDFYQLCSFSNFEIAKWDILIKELRGILEKSEGNKLEMILHLIHAFKAPTQRIF